MKLGDLILRQQTQQIQTENRTLVLSGPWTQHSLIVIVVGLELRNVSFERRHILAIQREETSQLEHLARDQEGMLLKSGIGCGGRRGFHEIELDERKRGRRRGQEQSKPTEICETQRRQIALGSQGAEQIFARVSSSSICDACDRPSLSAIVLLAQSACVYLPSSHLELSQRILCLLEVGLRRGRCGSCGHQCTQLLQ